MPNTRYAKLIAFAAVSALTAQPVLAGTCEWTKRTTDDTNWTANTKVINDTSMVLFAEMKYMKQFKPANGWTPLKSKVKLAQGAKIDVTLKNAKQDFIAFFITQYLADDPLWVQCGYVTDGAGANGLLEDKTSWNSWSCPTEKTDRIKVTCEKSWNRDKSRWNTKFRLLDADG